MITTRGRVGGIGVGEVASLQKRNFQDAEIIGRDAPNLFIRKNFLRHRIAAFDREGAVAVASR